MMMFSIKLFYQPWGVDMRLVYVQYTTFTFAADFAQLLHGSTGPACVFEICDLVYGEETPAIYI